MAIYARQPLGDLERRSQDEGYADEEDEGEDEEPRWLEGSQLCGGHTRAIWRVLRRPAKAPCYDVQLLYIVSIAHGA